MPPNHSRAGDTVNEMHEVVTFYRNMAEHYKRRCLELERAARNEPQQDNYTGRIYADPTGERAVRNLSRPH